MQKVYKHTAISAILLFVFAVSANAGIESCTIIENSLDRLSCYDIEAGFTPGRKEENVGSGNWNVKTELSKIDDSKNVWLNILSDEQTHCLYKSESHSIYIACRENTTSL